MIDMNALFKLTYGLYVAGVKKDAKEGGCVVDAVMQTTDDTLVLCCGKTTQTHDWIKETKRFSLSVLTRENAPSVIATFGFQSGRTADKWRGVARKTIDGLPVLETAAAWLTCRVTDSRDLGSHTLFFCAVETAETGKGEPITYTEYRTELKNETLCAFNTMKGNKKMTKWQCRICGYIYEGDSLPDDYVCPVCGVGADEFEKVEDKKQPKKEQWVCSVCGYVYDGETPFEELPDTYVCPVCKHPKSAFVKKTID